MSETINGVHQGDLEVRGVLHVNGVISGDATVVDAGRLELRGVVAGLLRVRAGGEANVSGVCAKAIRVDEGGRLDVTGVVAGKIRAEGDVKIAVGAVVDGFRVTEAGGWQAASDATRIAISNGTPRFRLDSTGNLSRP